MKIKFDNFHKGILLIMAFMVMSVVSYGQRTISGTILDTDSSEPLIGASVIVVGTTTGTITDIDGSYSLNVPADATAIEVSYTGYGTQVIQLGASNVLDVQLGAGEILDEVVVVGYGSVKRSDLTGSVASLESKDFNKGVVVNADQLLQGRLPGINVTNNSGQPGGEATVKIRGNNSIRAGANPLYVVDGVPLDGRSARAGLISSLIGDIPSSNPLNFLNPQDIESIQVLKDASSAAIYGSRASNGVIIVTTKKGRNSEPSISFSASAGVSSILKKYDILDGNEYRSALNDYGISGGDGGGNEDAFDAILQNGVTQNYNVSVGGGSQNGNYRVSLSYHDQDGIIKESGLDRYTATFNSNYTFLDDKLGVDLFVVASHSKEDISPISTNAGFRGNLVAQALQWNPTIPLMTGDEFTTALNSNGLVGATTVNPLQLLEAHTEIANTTTLIGSISPYFNITDNLQYRYRFGNNYGSGITKGGMAGFLNIEGIEGLGIAGVSNTTLLNQVHEHTLTYNDDFGTNNSFTLLGGYEYQKFNFEGFAFSGAGFDILSFNNVNALQNSDASNRNVFSFADPINELQSVFGRLNLNFNDRYLFTGTVRADGSTKFGENNRYGVFPSLAAAWNLHNEDFISGDNFDNLKLRVGWGITGNQEFPADAALATFTLNNNTGASQANTPNPDLQWESSTTFNVGLDFAIMDYFLSGSVEYYNRVTDNLLLDPFVSEPGPPVRAWRNIDGEVVNSGIELGLNANIINREDLRFSVGVNAAFLNNEFRDFASRIPAGELFGQGISNTTVQIFEDGVPLNTYFVRDYQGLDDSGNSIFANDGELTQFGDPNANTVLGFNLNLNAGGLIFGANFHGAFGHQLYNNTANSVLPIGNLGTRNIDSSLLGGAVQESLANPISASSRYIEDGDFLKLSNATIGYNFGDFGALKGLSVSLTGQNLFVITNFTGFDPEVNTVNLRSGVPSSGIEYIPYPSARTFLLTLGASF